MFPRMGLGARVTVVTTMLVAPVAALLGLAALQARRVDLENDLKRGAVEVAEALRAGMEPLVRETAEETVRERIAAANERGEGFKLQMLKINDAREADDPAWLLLAQGAEIEGRPVGRIVESSDGKRHFAMAVPLYDRRGLALPASHPARKPLAVIGMRRDIRTIDAEIAATARRLLPFLLGVVMFVGLGVLVAIRAAVVRPLRRLLDGINAVGRGDLSRVLLAERDDEIGTLAGRFNAMTASLRDARQETQRGLEARLALEARLRQSEKLATIGQMAAEIAHEVGTPLNVIGGRARLLGKKAAEPAEVAKNAGIITGEVDRIAKIIRQVLDFSRKRGPTLTRVHLGAVVAEALDFLGESIRRQGIKLDVRTMPAPPEVPGDPDQIQQVCLNLLTNALHAMPNGGKLRIATERVTRRKEGLDLAAPAEYAMLEVADSGPGIAAEHRERVFEPFFTTKGEGQGTGLGLAVSYGIVKEHDGWIEVDSPAQGGAVFRVFLPCAAAAGARAITVGDGAAPDLAEPARIGKD